MRKTLQSQPTGPAPSLSFRISAPKILAQPSLPFGLEPGSFNDDQLVRSTISAAIKASPLSREQIADAMTVMLGLRVTARMLNNFTSGSTSPARFPAAWDRAFCCAVADDSLLVCRVLRAGLIAISEEEKALLELGRQYLIRKRADEQADLIEKRLGGVEL